LGERLLCKQEVIGSIPFTSTNGHPPPPVQLCCTEAPLPPAKRSCAARQALRQQRCKRRGSEKSTPHRCGATRGGG
jgi:hypothetical protein